MKTFIIRKPKFMRNDEGMKAYLTIAETISKEMCNTDSLDERYCLLKMTGECINEAAKAGGFLSTEGFIKWMNSKKTR